MEENKMSELEEMRQQLSILQNKLEKQDIVNDKLLKASMKSKMSWIKKFIIGETIAIPILAILFAGMYSFFNISFISYIFLMLLLVIDVYIDYIININCMKPTDYENNNLLQTAKKLIKMKKLRARQTFIGIILMIIWGIWFGYGLYNASPLINNPFFRGAAEGSFVGLIIGGILGLTIGYMIYRRMQKTNDELIDQIKEITDK